MTTSLAIFIAIAATGSAFLIYFLYALWRDAGSSKQSRASAYHHVASSKCAQG
jgi:threonine/homoserine/homoserine lactone efflux protein